MESATVEIEILNWDKYNPRKDLKATTWVRLQNSLFEDPSFFDFTHSELMFWVYLLSIASKKQSGQIRFNWNHAERIGRFKRDDICSAFEKLQSLECVRTSGPVRNVDVTPTSRARHADVTPTSHYERTNERNVTKVTDGCEPYV